jgi:putative membrane protein
MSGSRFSRFIIKLIVLCLALLVVVKLCPWAEVDGAGALIVAALLLGIFNAFIRPVIIILTIPINIVTLGLFTFIINGVILYLVSLLVPGFVLESFLHAILTALLVSVVSWLINILIGDKR